MASTSIDAIAKVLEMSAKIVEEELDAELNQLKQMDEDDLEKLRERRLEALKKAHKRKQVFGLFLYNPQPTILFIFYKIKFSNNNQLSKQCKRLLSISVVICEQKGKNSIAYK